MPSAGSFANVFKELSDNIHSSVVRTREGRVLIPDYISKVEKRFLIKFLICIGEEPAIMGEDSIIRPIHSTDYETPPPSIVSTEE